MSWWMEMLPLGLRRWTAVIQYHGMQRVVKEQRPTEANPDAVMLLRRASRGSTPAAFFDYPIRLSKTTINWACAHRHRDQLFPERLFPLNRNTISSSFSSTGSATSSISRFSSPTRKKCGACLHQIDAAWGAQRIKGLSSGDTAPCCKKLCSRPVTRISTEGRDVAHRAIPISEARSRTDVGRDRAARPRDGRGDSDTAIR